MVIAPKLPWWTKGKCSHVRFPLSDKPVNPVSSMVWIRAPLVHLQDCVIVGPPLVTVVGQCGIIIRECIKRVTCCSWFAGIFQEILKYLIAGGIVFCHDVENAVLLFLEAIPPKLMKIDCLSKFSDSHDRNEYIVVRIVWNSNIVANHLHGLSWKVRKICRNFRAF